MKKAVIVSFVFTLILIWSVSCIDKNGAQGNDTSVKNDTIQGTPQIKFVVDSHDFGKIVEGEIVSYTFFYENAGNSGLIITSASATCGCTIPNYSKEPLPGGDRGKIEVVFDSNGKLGVQNKSIAIRTNGTPARKILNIHAEVVISVN